MQTTPASSAPAKAFPGWLRFFAPTPPAAIQLTDPAAIQTRYQTFRFRILLWSTVGYATFYLVRKNLPIAMPSMEEDLHISKTQLGIFLTLHGVLYGVSKFLNGFFADRCNARSFMVVGLTVSAILNIAFAVVSAIPSRPNFFLGYSSLIFGLGSIWMLNGWFQGMGFPPCARLLTHWFSPKALATKMSIWNTSHCAGAVVILLLGGWLVTFGWRYCFLVPAALAFACVIVLWFTIADTPPSVGLPEVEGTPQISIEERSADDVQDVWRRRAQAEAGGAASANGNFGQTLVRHVFSNKYIWLVSIANFFVYTLRYGVFDWGPTLLKQSKHIEIRHAAWMLAGFEVFGAIGALIGGWVTDRFFGGRGMRASVFFMIMAGVSLFLLWKTAGDSKLLNSTLLCLSGFFIYGPQCLIGIAAANLATRRAAASAVGLTGLFGYASTLLSGWGLGSLVEHRGWDAGFVGLLIIAALGTLCFIAAWPAKAHGYAENSNDQPSNSK